MLLIANAGLIRRTADDASGASARLVALWLGGATEIDVEMTPAVPTEQQIGQALPRG